MPRFFRCLQILSLFITSISLVGCGESASSTDSSSESATDAVTANGSPLDAKVEESKRDDLAAEFKDLARQLRESSNPYYGRAQLKELAEVDLASLNNVERANHHMALSWHLLRLGELEESIAEIERAYDLRHGGDSEFPLQAVQMSRAITYLRQAEEENCIKRKNCDCCIFPLAGGGLHVDREPAQASRDALLEILDRSPDNLHAVWLLNVLTMALGEYPDGVPPVFRLPEASFTSSYDVKRFPDIAKSLGVDAFNLCGGVVVEDFNGDRQLDIASSTYDPAGHMVCYLNNGKGFQNTTAPSNLGQQFGGLNCIGADYDSDGDTDILVLRGAWLKELGEIRNSLLRNNGQGQFEDVTAEAGLANPAYPTQAAVWGDFNNDGHLDLYIVNECRSTVPYSDGYYPAQLYMNEGDGTFVDRASSAGVINMRYGKGVTTGDYDRDGDLDIYVSNIGPNRLYQNQGDGTFEDIAIPLKLTQPAARSFATWFFDYDNDGWLDLFVTAYDATVDQLSRHYLGEKHGATRPRLYRNLGNGRFRELGEELGLNFPCLPMGANFGDLDNDGYPDIYLTTGDPLYQTLMPNIMLRNQAGDAFVDVTTSGGFGHLQKGHGIAFADLDNDGDQDIYHQLGGFFPGDKFCNALFQNPGHDNRFVTLRLIGTNSNRSAIGARIEVVIETDQGERSIFRNVGSVSSFGGSPLRQEIGLGAAKSIKRIEIIWPRSQEKQVLEDVDLDGWLEVTEGKDKAVVVDPPHVKWPTPQIQ